MTILKLGSRGEAVRQVQKALHLLPDGIYGYETERAVRQFQMEHHLTVDGMVGPATLAKLLPSRLKRSRRMIKEIIVHCTATPEGKPLLDRRVLRRRHDPRRPNTQGHPHPAAAVSPAQSAH